MENPFGGYQKPISLLFNILGWKKNYKISGPKNPSLALEKKITKFPGPTTGSATVPLHCCVGLNFWLLFRSLWEGCKVFWALVVWTRKLILLHANNGALNALNHRDYTTLWSGVGVLGCAMTCFRRIFAQIGGHRLNLSLIHNFNSFQYFFFKFFAKNR